MPDLRTRRRIGCAPGSRPGRSLIALRCFALLGAFVVLVSFVSSAAAQPAATGSIEGRVQNVVTRAYLNNARVTVQGTSLVTFTDASGHYLLNNVPAGDVTVRVFFTGLDEKLIPVTLASGETARVDVDLTSVSRYGEMGEATVLDEFVVQSAKETDASTIAVNEQRFAPNIISVVSADEFGNIVDKNPGEFLKWLPGVDVETFANNITGVSVRGLGSQNTEVNFDGMPIASANAEAVSRSADVQYASAADIARVEVRKLPLPQDSANAIGGSINLIRRSAFEYNRRQISYQALFQADGEKLTMDDIDGPKDRLRSRWRPNWEVKWTEPISDNLGLAVTVGQNETIVNTHWSLPGWDLGSSANNAAAEAALAAGQPVPTVPSIFNPGMRNPLNHNAPLMQGKDYASARIDWRPFPALTLSYSPSYTKGWKEVADDIRYRWDNSATGSGNRERYVDDTTSLGRLGGGGIFHDNPLWRDIDTPTTTHVFDAKWKQGDWEAGLSGVYSRSTYRYKDIENGFFNSTSVNNVDGLVNIPHAGVGAGTANPMSLTVNYYDTGYWAPGSIEALTTATGAASTSADAYNVPVDWWSNDVIRIGGARSRPGSGKELVGAAKIFAKRHFDFHNPLSLRVGFDYLERFKNRRYPYHTWRFVGADGVPNSADDSASLIAAENLRARPDSVYGYPGAERISMTKLYDLYEEHPDWFRYDEARSTRLSLTQNPDYDLTETTTAEYIEFDWLLFKNRLRLNGGVRHERNKGEARGLYANSNAAYMKYADGSVVHLNDLAADGSALVRNMGTSTNVNYVLVNGPSALPATRSGAPIFLPSIQAAGNAARAAGETTDSNTNLGRGTLAHTAAVFQRMGAQAESETSEFFPSLHLSYNLTDNLILQAGYARTQAKNRYDRSIIPNTEITENPAGGTSALGRIEVRNKDLEPWIGDNFEARLSYYTPSGGVLGLGAFHKIIHNYQLNVISEPMTAAQATQLAEQFPELGLGGASFAGYELETWQNVGEARIDGAEFEMRQSLDPFVPSWARGFLVRGAATFTKLKGQPAGGDFNNLRERRYTLNVGYNRGKFHANLGYIMNGEIVNNGRITSNGYVGEQVYVAQDLVDFNVEYAITKWARVFVSGSNIFDELRAREDRYAERPDAKEMGSSNSLGVTFTVGVTGTF